MESGSKTGYGGIVQEEKRVESDADELSWKEERVPKVGNERIDRDDNSLKPASAKSNGKELNTSPDKEEVDMTRMESSSRLSNSKASSLTPKEQDDQLASTKAEMGAVREENQRLKTYLDQIMKDYQTLQIQFRYIVQQEAQKSASTNNHQDVEETELVSLTLGRTSSSPTREEKCKTPGKNKVDEQDKEGLALVLNAYYDMPKVSATESPTNTSSESSLEEVKEDSRETLPTQRTLKTVRSGEDEVSEQNPAKKARVSVRVRCDTPTMNDGCQWRKYGQKIAKGNPCPRAYYRCTVAPNCPVRKQVQRCAEDMSILITTYEGTHNHPLPISATAMASTTSAAASMLMSGSSTSTSNPCSQLVTATAVTTPAELHGLNYYLSNNSKQFYLPNSSISPSHPTITLDLTSNTSSSSSHVNNNVPTNFPTRFSSTNLNFSSLESNPLPISWNNGVLSYGTQPYNKNQIGALSFGKQAKENIYQSYLQQNILTATPQSVEADTIAAATKALTSDPSFRSALAAALTSIIGSDNGRDGTLGNHAGGDKFGQNLKLVGDSFPILSNFPSTSSPSKCSSGFLNKSSLATNSQTGNLMFLSPPLPFPTSKNKPPSPGDDV